MLGLGFRLEITSHLWFLTILQALALKNALEAKGLSSNLYVGMRYWYPFTEEAVHQVSPYMFQIKCDYFTMF